MEPTTSPTPETVAVEEGTASVRLEFQGEGGTQLVGELWAASAGAPAVVLMHQLSAERGEWAPVVEALRPLGVTVFAFDQRGHGESEGEWRSFGEADWAKLPADVSAALRVLRHHEVAPSKFVLGGSSIGSSAAILSGAREDDVVGVFALSPGRAYRGLDTITPAATYAPRLLAIAAEGETPAKETAEELARVASRGSVQLLEGSAHGLRMMEATPDLPARIRTFVEQALER